MKNFQYITAKEAYGTLYYQLPKVLFTSELYKYMSNDSKIAYAMLQDRCEYSIQNNWVDEEGHVYFIYTRNELMNILGCKENKIAKIKKELREKNLLFEKRIPPKKMPDGNFKNYPNRLYLGKLEVTAQDVYNTSKFSNLNDFTESGKNPLSVKPNDNSISIESGKNPLPKKPININGSVESGRNPHNQYKSCLNIDTLLDTLLDTKNKDFEDIDKLNSLKEQQREEYLLKHYAESHEEQSFLNQENLNLIGLFSDSLADAHNMQGIILRAKKEMEKKHNAVLVVDEGYMHDDLLEIQKDIRKTLHRLYQQRKTDEKIDNFDNYCYGSFKKLFDKKIGEWKIIAAEQGKTDLTVSTHNWLN